MNRRNFLVGIACGVGTVMVSACDGSAPAPSTPTGFRFVPLLRTGDALPAGNKLASFPSLASLNSIGHVHVLVDDDKGIGHFLRLELDGNAPSAVAGPTTAVGRHGMDLPEGLKAIHIEAISANERGSFAFRASMTNGQTSYFLATRNGPIVRVFKPLSQAPGGVGRFGFMNGAFELLDDDSLLVVTGFADARSKIPRSRMGLFHLQEAGNSEKGSLVLAAGDLLPGVGDTLGAFGLLDGESVSGSFVSQVFLPTPPIKPAQAPETPLRSVCIAGKIADKSLRVLTLPQSSQVSEALRGSILSGDLHLAPRVSRYQEISGVLTTPGQRALFSRERVQLRTGDRTPLGNTVRDFLTHTPGGRGQVFAHVQTNEGVDEILLGHDKGNHTVLATGTELLGKRVKQLSFGSTRDQVDTTGRLVCHATFEDGSTSLLLGLPV